MYVSFTLSELKETFADVAAVAVAAYRKEANQADDKLSQREAFELFGRKRVTAWREKGLISAIRGCNSANSKIVFSKSELMQLDAADKLRPIMNRASDTPTAPRFTFGK